MGAYSSSILTHLATRAALCKTDVTSTITYTGIKINVKNVQLIWYANHLKRFNIMELASVCMSTHAFMKAYSFGRSTEWMTWMNRTLIFLVLSYARTHAPPYTIFSIQWFNYIEFETLNMDLYWIEKKFIMKKLVLSTPDILSLPYCSCRTLCRPRILPTYTTFLKLN